MRWKLYSLSACGAAMLLGGVLIWAYQQPVFAKAGYRVIAYSRRGHHNSAPVPQDNPGTAVDDLHNLIGLLGIGKFHVVGSAAGCAVAIDYALSHPERLLSITLAGGTGGVRDPLRARLGRAPNRGYRGRVHPRRAGPPLDRWRRDGFLGGGDHDGPADGS